MAPSSFDEASNLLSIGVESNTSSDRSQNSPFRVASYELNDRKEKRQPSITPRKFQRFFTPRSYDAIPSSSFRRVLEDITSPVNNRNGIQSSLLSPSETNTAGDSSSTVFTRDMKRRKLLHTPSSSFDGSSPEKSSLADPPGKFEFNNSEDINHVQSSPCSKAVERRIEGLGSRTIADKSGKQVKHLDSQGLVGQLLQQNIGYGSRYNRCGRSGPISDWQDQTAKFYSLPEDTHFCTNIENSTRSIPFCVASCNTNSLVAIGDEEGQVRLLESAKNGKPKFKDVFLGFRPHSNAIIDLSFSLDDSILATASGDQTARVVDMTTQTTTSVLAQHSASLKQVRFQPGAANNSVIATSSRDGSLQIWDLRCKGTERPVLGVHVPLDPPIPSNIGFRKSNVTYSRVVNSIYNAHRPASYGRLSQPAVTREGPPRGEAPGRIGDVSVTAITFLPNGREHLLLTASEANASVKLWDLRSLHNTRRKSTLPLSCTAQPGNHSQWRQFGINSLNLSGDGSRFYALCKDNTVYVYSTAHLILGHSPELSIKTTSRRRQPIGVHESLGPLYGFRHPQLHATSFYVKSAIRTAKAGKCEMLAVGSCDGCTLLFPTDERYLEQQQGFSRSQNPVGTGVRRIPSHTADSSHYPDSIPISERGTPLIRGHNREVSALSWTSEGELVTVGDDFLVRCWREGDSARKMRTNGEQGGQRWGCGWANVPELYDSDEVDE